MNTINVHDYLYELPPDKIASYPLAERDQSKLLFFNKSNISHHVFKDMPSLLPKNSLLFFNNTKVIPARLHFKKNTGATIEIFLLTPLEPSTLLTEAMGTTATCIWKCTIGNRKRWNENDSIIKSKHDISLTASLINRDEGIVKFTWDTPHSFHEIIDTMGETPLPPYIHRQVTKSDKERYQTIYSQYQGAVAAPTAGLHFTPHIMETLKEKGIMMDFITLHVSAGTFQPIKVDDATKHTMHNEQVIITTENIENLLQTDRMIVAVGTTSMRTLESLYWFGAKLIHDKNAIFDITQFDPYTIKSAPTKREALEIVVAYMKEHDLNVLVGNTSIYIVPGYSFKICDGLITNFHQPSSTLILLVAAFIGDNWKKVYEEALKNNYRFLSYGDSSLLIPE